MFGTIGLYVWKLVVQRTSIAEAQTVAFATIIAFELFHAFNAKSFNESIFGKKFFSNMYVIGGVIIAALLTFIVIYFPPLQAIFGTMSLPISDWTAILLVSSSVLFFVELQKTILQAELKERARMEIYPTRRV